MEDLSKISRGSRTEHRLRSGERRLDRTALWEIQTSPRQIFLGGFKSRRMRWAGHVTRMAEKRNAYKLLVGKPGGNK
jgi:hypothetical protein